MKLARFFGLNAEKGTTDDGVNTDIVDYDEKIAMVQETEGTAGISQQEIFRIAVADIEPNPFQPRKTFYDDSLAELSASIKEFGVIQPLLVRRKTHDTFELIAGERRLRASKLAGLENVPVIIKELNDQEMAELAMIENLQREDLHFLEEAEGFQQLIANFGFTQDALALRVGKKQSTIANKLRLLRLPEDIRDILRQEELTERHARALLKVEDATIQKRVLDAVCKDKLNVRQTEALIEEIHNEISREMPQKAPKQNVVKIIKDVRIFLNTINKVVNEIKKAGLNVQIKQEQDDDYIRVTMRIPKRRS
ncbi:hypothetical protein P22_1855 [Propionispora sp. 2/2-37]|uniref:nucleoid occlusion protein n=1 Tax=Propionispora sp. 2/2-37 TaxID=1677858 RepID=UPI0006BB83F4|nr:nucleoid occlusion protein [Propionispora sp. 2/2-37]CUH95775.1 hypothetical protein P22_1855 [Propionispora sp. 2/2-37]